MGERSGKVLLGLILLIVGAVVFLDMAGISLGFLLQYLIPGAIMIYGAKQVLRSGSGGKLWGAFVFLFGLLMLAGKLHLLFSCLLAVVAIYYGYRLLRGRPEPVHPMPDIIERRWAEAVLKEDDLDRWERQYHKGEQ